LKEYSLKSNVMKKLLFAQLFLFVFTRAVCQDKFFKSSIVLKDGTIEKGYISNLYDSKTIKFRKNSKSKEVIYTPYQLKGFLLENNLYATKIVKINHYKYGESNLGTVGEVPATLNIDRERGQTTDTVFCQKVISGPLNLYKLRYTNDATYLLVEKDSILRELPRKYYINESESIIQTNSQQMSAKTQLNYKYTSHEFRAYMDTLALVCDSNYYKSLKPFQYSENNIIATVQNNNKKLGKPNGGYIMGKTPRSFFYGGAVGTIPIRRDEFYKYEPSTFSMSYRGNVLTPITGFNRHAFAVLGVSYDAYGNDKRSVSVVSTSVGIRYATLSGFVRPYFQASLAFAKQFVNNKPASTSFPGVLEAGVLVPVQDFYLTVGATFSPITYTSNDGYQLFSWHIGVMF
jgi:hypothetical protein